jgi:hypothetical protein
MKRTLLVIENDKIILTEEGKAYLIEKAKANDVKAVEQLTGSFKSYSFTKHPRYFLFDNKVIVTNEIIKEHIKSINPNFDKNKMEIMLCDQNSPTEVLEIINHITNLIVSSHNQCTGLFLNNYFCLNIYQHILNQFSNSQMLFGDAPEDTKKNESMINNIKFLCDVIMNNFPDPKIEIVQPLATVIRQHTNPKVIQELQPFLDFAASMEPGKSNTATSSKPNLV